MSYRVLQLGKFHPIRGGVEKVMEAFTCGLSCRGYECDMLCASEDGSTNEISLNGYGRIIKTPTWTKKAATMLSPGMIFKLRKICRDYDIIHIHHPDPMAALALFMSGYRGRVILHWHSDIVKQKNLLKLYAPLQNWLIHRADRIVGTTPTYVAESPALKRVQDKVSYLPIGVQEPKASLQDIARIREKYKGKKIILSMGRLVEYKGYEYLISAAETLEDDYVILIGGKGELMPQLEEQIHRLHLEDKVHLLGYVADEEIGAYYHACDVFCLSSTIKTEAYAIVQVEAMASGKPVVSTNIPGSGVSWVNEHGVSGLNAPVCDAVGLAKAIQQICQTPETYTRYSLAAKARYRMMFRSEDMIDRLLRLYEELLDNHSPFISMNPATI